ncbi:MAG: lipoyl(octanoyl) transferase LipB [Anaerolineae bacterium]
MSEITWCVELGRMAYGPALDLQHRLVAARQAGRIPDVLLLLEHDPVITLGRRANPAHILVPPDLLRQAGIEVRHVERGGDVTYHGPGQLVGYPILHLHQRQLGVGDYMHLLERMLIAALADFGLRAGTRPEYVGVWLGRNKVAALGARVEKGVSYHGFALNVNTDLQAFSLIVPCGITDGGVTSIARELGKVADWQAAQAAVQYHFAAFFHTRLEPLSAEDLTARLDGDGQP